MYFKYNKWYAHAFATLTKIIYFPMGLATCLIKED